MGFFPLDLCRSRLLPPWTCTILWFSILMLDGLFQNFTTAKSSPKIVTFSSLILKLLTQLFFFFCIETLSSPKRDGVDKSVTKNSLWVEDLDNNLPINPSQLSLFRLCTCVMEYGCAASAVKTCWLCMAFYQMVCKPAARNRQNWITNQQLWNSTQRPTQRDAEGY